MELFSLLAKLTLDRTEYDREVSQAEGESIELPDATLDLDASDFDSGIDEANDAEVDDIDADLTLDNEDFNSSLKDSEEQADSFGSTVGSVFENLKGVIVATGIVAAVTGIVNSLKEGIQLAGKNGDTIDKQSKALHLSRDAYQELSYAMELSGGSVTDLTRAMRNFDQIKGNNATDDQAAALKALGINAEEAADAQDLLFQSMYALADYTGSDKGVLAKALFGNNYGQFEALFASGAEGIKQMQEEAHDLGLVMTDDEINNAVEYTDSMTRLNRAIEGLKTSFVSDIMPVITDAINGLARIVAFFNGRTKENSLSEQWAEDDKALSEELKTIEGTSVAAETLADKLLAMGDTSQMTAEQYAIWKGTAEELIRLVPSLGDVIDTESGKINANSAEIKENIKQWENLAKQKAIQALKEKKYQDIVEKNQDLIDKQINLNNKEAEASEKKAAAIEAANAYLQDEEQGAYRQQIYGMEQVDESNFGKALAIFTQLEGEAGKAMREYNNVANEIYGLKDEVKAAEEKLSEGMKEYETYSATADEIINSLTSNADEATKSAESIKKALDDIPNEKIVKLIIDGDIPHYTYAKGSWNIPNDQVAVLHRGERVLTASQARQSDSSESTGAIVSAIQSLKTDMQNLRIMVGKKTFAKTVVDYSGNNVGDYIGESTSRQEAGYGT
ncbi:MAG: hypothetical protein J6Y48_01145 [Clostridia bacterium]|nr:hypothetical protein [Clostridia bacterium]